MHGKKYSITSVIFLPKMQNLNPMRKHQINPSWGTSSKTTGLSTFYFLCISWFIMLSISAIQQSDPMCVCVCVCVCVQILFIILCSIMFHHKWLDIVPCAIHRISWPIHSKCNTLYLLTPNSQSIPLPPHPLGNHKSVLYVHEFVSVM